MVSSRYSRLLVFAVISVIGFKEIHGSMMGKASKSMGSTKSMGSSPKSMGSQPTAPKSPAPPKMIPKSPKAPKEPKDTKKPSIPKTAKPSNVSPVTFPVKGPTKKTKSPVAAPTHAPVKSPVRTPSATPVRRPVKGPTKAPIPVPSKAPSTAPTHAPVKSPNRIPSATPVRKPVKGPTRAPIPVPSKAPSRAPLKSPVKVPVKAPTKGPVKTPSNVPLPKSTPMPSLKARKFAWINEFHYANSGTDIDQFVEVAATDNIDLAGWLVYPYNGDTGNSYDTLSLGSGTPTGSGISLSVVIANQPFQSGPDGFALVDPLGTVIEFISYGGAFTAVSGPAKGMTSVDVGVEELGNELPGLSLQLTGTGCSSEDFTWAGPLDETKGLINTGQIIRCAVAPTKAPVGPPTATTAAPIVPPTATQPPAVSPGRTAWINEFHYANSGTDVNEFVEVAATDNIDLAGWLVYPYNGDTGNPYDALSLGSGTPTGSGISLSVVIANQPFQNGPDGFALVDPLGTVIEFISYGGAFTAVSGPAKGMTSMDVKVTETGNELPGLSLQLTGTGCSSNDFVWSGPLSATPSAVNIQQVIACAPSTRAPATRPTATSVAPITIPTTTTGPIKPPTLAPASAPTKKSAWINEFHYANSGSDVDEFVEVAATDNIDLAGWLLYPYNGDTGNAYDVISLDSGFSTGQGISLFVAQANQPFQNGPDGFALVDPSGVVIEFISYGGPFTAVSGPAAGMTSVDVQIQETGNDIPGSSLQLAGTGCARSSFTWNGPLKSTAGSINTGQTIQCSGGSVEKIPKQTQGASSSSPAWAPSPKLNASFEFYLPTATPATHIPTLAPSPGLATDTPTASPIISTQAPTTGPSFLTSSPGLATDTPTASPIISTHRPTTGPLF